MASHRHKWLIVGISGVTCGGKTTLALNLSRLVLGSVALHQDAYFLPDADPRHQRCPGLQHNNYDVLSALDMPRMYSDIMRTIESEGSPEGCSGCGPEGCAGAGGERRLRVPGRRVLIVEGFTVLNYAPIAHLCDLKYYFVLEYEQCLSRRVHRLYDPPDVPGYFDRCVWPEHLRYRREIENDPSVQMLDGTSPDVLQLVLRDLRAKGAVPCPE